MARRRSESLVKGTPEILGSRYKKAAGLACDGQHQNEHKAGHKNDNDELPTHVIPPFDLP
jgi:hypothetical protein